MSPEKIHYRAFVETVESGIFDGESIGNYLEYLKNNAKYVRSPVNHDSTYAAIADSRKDAEAYVDSYIEKALANKKVLPFDHAVCIEDDFSAVFIENYSDDETVRVTLYVDTEKEHEFKGILCSGVLKLLGSEEGKSFFGINPSSELYASFVHDDHVVPQDMRSFEAMYIAQDLVQAAIVAIEELAYLEKVKTSNGKERKTN